MLGASYWSCWVTDMGLLLNPEEAFGYAQADSEELLRGESTEGWELLARWRVWLVHWGRFQDELAAGSAAHAENPLVAVGKFLRMIRTDYWAGFAGVETCWNHETYLLGTRIYIYIYTLSFQGLFF